MSDNEAVTPDDPIVTLKNAGNAKYAEGNFALAIDSFTAAILLVRERLIGADLVATTPTPPAGLTHKEHKKTLDEGVRARNEDKVLAATLFCNRSMCHASLGNCEASIADAKLVSDPPAL